MKIETKFEIGDRVTDGSITGKITYIKATNYTSYTKPYTDIEYSIEVESRNDYTIYVREESRLTLAPKKLTPEEAWVEVFLMLVEETHKLVGPKGYQSYLWDVDKTAMRHQAYIILGGSGVDCNANHEEIKAKLNEVINRLENSIRPS